MVKCFRVVDPETSIVVLLFSLRAFSLRRFGCRGIFILERVLLTEALDGEPVIVEVGAEDEDRPGGVVELGHVEVRGKEAVSREGRGPRRDLMLDDLCPSRDLIPGVGLRAGGVGAYGGPGISG